MNLFSKLTLTGIELNHIDLLSDSEYFWLVTNESFQYRASSTKLPSPWMKP